MYAKSLYAISRFLTPPRLAPLDLDLTKVRDEGSCPAQFHGETADGRAVYGRYRYGWLSVDIANFPGAGVHADGTRLLEERIGPPLDGYMTAHWFCHLTGITVNGGKPEVDLATGLANEEVRHDLGGDTTFYNVDLNSTHGTQRRFLSALLEQTPDALIVQRDYSVEGKPSGGKICRSVDDVTRDGVFILFPRDIDLSRLAERSFSCRLTTLYPGALVMYVGLSGFERPMWTYSDMATQWVKKTVGKDVLVAGTCDELPYGPFRVSADFPANDTRRRAWVERIDRLVDSIYPAFRQRMFRVVSGVEQPDPDRVVHCDPAIAAWVNGAENRYYFIENVRGVVPPRAVGCKLFPVS